MEKCCFKSRANLKWLWDVYIIFSPLSLEVSRQELETLCVSGYKPKFTKKESTNEYVVQMSNLLRYYETNKK